MFAFSGAGGKVVSFSFTSGPEDNVDLGGGITLYGRGHGSVSGLTVTSPDWPNPEVASGITVSVLLLHKINSGPWTAITVDLAGTTNQVGQYIERIRCIDANLDVTLSPTSEPSVGIFSPPAAVPNDPPFSTSTTQIVELYLR